VVQPSHGKTGDSDKPPMVDSIGNKEDEAHVGIGASRRTLASSARRRASPISAPIADGHWKNNLPTC